MQCPENDKNSINILNNILIFQILLLNEKSFSIEVRATDNSDIKRRFNFSTSFKDIETHEFHIQIPLTILISNIWTNIYINIGNLLSQSFGNKNIKSIDYISIGGCCKVRKIYAIKNINDPINKGILLSKKTLIKNMKIDNIISGLEDYNIIVPNTLNKNINLVDLGNTLNQDNNNQSNIKENKINKPSNKKNENLNNLNDEEKNDLNSNNKKKVKLADTLKKKTKDNLKLMKKIPDFNVLNNQIQLNEKVGIKNKNSNNNKISEKNTINKTKSGPSKLNNQDNKKDNLINNQKEINQNQNKFNKFGLFDANNLLKPSTLNESIEEIYDLNENPLAESIMVKSPEINTVTNIKNEDIIHIDKQNFNSIINTQKLLNDINNQQKNVNNEFLNTEFFDNLQIEDLRENCNNENNRPYSPPIGKMIPVSTNDNKRIDINKMNFNDRDLNPLINSLASITSVSTKLNNKAIQNYDNLIYDEKIGKYFDPITNIYYDIKNKENK